MLSYVWVAIGSAAGGMARYACTGLATRYFGETFPWGTLIINVSGSLAIGFLATLAAPDGRPLLSHDARLLVLIGVCGGFTTFSTFSIDTLNLARNGEWLWAGANVVGSLALCLVAVWLGHAAAVALSR
jgi:CrcB protein